MPLDLYLKEEDCASRLFNKILAAATPLKIAEWVGALFGLFGAVLVGSNSPWTKYGLLAYLASNFCLIFFGLKHKAWGFLAMQLGFVAAGVFGVYRWFIVA